MTFLCLPELRIPLSPAFFWYWLVLELKWERKLDCTSLSVCNGQICSAITSVHNSSSELLFCRTSGWRIVLPSCFIIFKFLFHCFLMFRQHWLLVLKTFPLEPALRRWSCVPMIGGREKGCLWLWGRVRLSLLGWVGEWQSLWHWGLWQLKGC